MNKRMTHKKKKTTQGMMETRQTKERDHHISRLAIFFEEKAGDESTPTVAPLESQNTHKKGVIRLYD